MSCNPSIGGPGKSHLVSELGILGGQMAKHIDKYNLQLKNLNHTKGLAARITRAQADKYDYRIQMRKILENEPNLSIIQGEITELIVENNKIVGVVDNLSNRYNCHCAILCTGTFLKGEYIIGDVKYSSGRVGEKASNSLSDNLINLGIEIDRYQTATPPRILKSSIDFSKMEKLEGTLNPRFFSPETNTTLENTNPTYLTYTSVKTIEVAKQMLKYSPIVTGIVSTKGPRHCPSLDRKVMNFPDKYDHQIFLEQESTKSDEIYVNGFTTAMPPFAQEKILRTIIGLENAKIVRYGYAIEYNFIPAHQIKHTMESKIIQNLYTAGTINGTSGYEEAASQGFIAGVNAARKIQNKSEIILTRDNSYIGVMIDDIINKKTPEPYRVLPSRAEYRLNLRQDNIFIRLIDISKEIGILDKNILDTLYSYIDMIENEIDRLKNIKIFPTKQNNLITKMNNPVSAYEFLARQDMDYNTLGKIIEIKDLPDKVIEQVEINAKYDVFIKREQKQIDEYKKLDNILIPDDFDYEKVTGLSNIAKSSLMYNKPKTIAMANSISGVTYNDIAILIGYLKI